MLAPVLALLVLSEAFLLRFLLTLLKESLFARRETKLRREARSRTDKRAERFQSAA